VKGKVSFRVFINAGPGTDLSLKETRTATHQTDRAVKGKEKRGVAGRKDGITSAPTELQPPTWP